MKKLASLLVLLTGLFLSGRAQTACNASLTWTQTANSYNVVFTNNSTVAPAVPSSPFAGTNRMVWINGQYYNSNPTYTHNFPGPGSYPVVAYVSYLDSVNGMAINCSDTTQYTVVVTQQPCAVSITSVTGSSLTRNFVANGGTGASGTTYTWNFGDGSPTVTGVSVSHTYTTGGTYTVTVTAMGNGCTGNASTSVSLASTPVLNCANVSNGFTSTGTGSTRVFYPSATPINFPRTHYWNFGNGNTATSSGSSSVTSAFTTPGTYTVCLLTMWTDSANSITCTDTACQTITITSGGGTNFNCATASNSVSASVSGATVTLTPTVTPLSTTGITVQNYWQFGNGWGSGGAYTAPQTFTYSASGTYTARWITHWIQTSNSAILCRDTAYVTYTINVPVQNLITGFVRTDSTVNTDSFKVWLITYNPQTNLLAAIDSTYTMGNGFAPFQFSNKPAGVYRTKAAKLNQTPSSIGYVPTYRDSSLTWSGAVTFSHNNALTTSGGIYMRQGIVSSGPGFVGGSVLSGANKGTADGDPVVNQLVFLRDATTGSLVQSAYTNASGAYSFSNLPPGSYRVYPEEMNYATTASAPLTLTANSASVNGILFKKDDVDRDIKQVTAGVNDVNGAQLGFTIVPNPANDRVQISLTSGGNADVRIFSVSGKKVYEQRAVSGKSTTLELGHLPAGVYSVHVTGAAQVGTAKLVIAR